MTYDGAVQTAVYYSQNPTSPETATVGARLDSGDFELQFRTALKIEVTVLPPSSPPHGMRTS